MESNGSFFSFQEHCWFQCSPQRTHRCCFAKFLTDCSQIYLPGQRWTLATSLDAFEGHAIISTAICWGFCQPIPCTLCCTLLAAMEKNVLHTPWQRVTENEQTIFLLGQYQYVSIQLGLTASIESARSTAHTLCWEGQCLVSSFYALSTKHISDLESLGHFSGSHYVLTAFVPHMYYRTQEIHISQKSMSCSQGLQYYLLHRVPCHFRG